MSEEKPKVCLAMPGYGELTAAAACGFYCAATPRFDIDRMHNEGSLLAQNFNSLWCWALNKVHNGERVDYFAMQHSDVGPEVGWLETMIDELEAKQLDVLGAAVPIKSQNGLTSLALGREDGSTWRVKCRLTMDEVHRLPETFTQEDTGHPLLLNTGLWVAKFNTEWANQIHFTINDRIVFDTITGTYRAEVEPEDWFFSRLCNDLGLKIGATRKVTLQHQGKIAFSNESAWGLDKFDSEYLTESAIPDNSRTEHSAAIPLEV